ncbi:OsmC family protein [Persicirhabdus sediminis]|uniref:OsmC family protein n=1 Tax=Persicirhabdus sediminis TaxID=454144 RepID=A0A8J7MDG6_9BACT|nr:OsmC family protein [Persicirhabdus sediminis]MBK1791037.1 OsmC family protein [Persicirhabdus sediminis]
MVQINVEYQGELHCEAIHGPSSSVLVTDAPVDNNGKGEAFSPTDLVATALASCMATIMGMRADQLGVDLKGMKIVIEKEMSADLPRRIIRLAVVLDVPVAAESPHCAALIQAADHCPVKHSIHSDIAVDMQWNWLG